MQGIYDNLIDYYKKDANGVSKADVKQVAESPVAPVAPQPKTSSWGWFKRRASAPTAETQEVKNTGTNYTIIHNTAAPTHITSYAAPKGVYIWGGPGCGKTYLMDLLYNSIQCADIKTARVDFHSFMLEIHMKLHQFRQKYGLASLWV